MPYRRSKMGALIQFDPDAAAKELLAVFRACGGSADDAAERFQVTRRTFDRWVRTLGLEAKVAEIRSRR